MMQQSASFLCRGIEAVITGLTRNQFVDNTTRGFESLPLRQRKQTPISGVCFLSFGTVGEDSRPAPSGAGFAYAAKHASSSLVSCKRAYIRVANTPSLRVCLSFVFLVSCDAKQPRNFCVAVVFLYSGSLIPERVSEITIWSRRRTLFERASYGRRLLCVFARSLFSCA